MDDCTFRGRKTFAELNSAGAQGAFTNPGHDVAVHIKFILAPTPVLFDPSLFAAPSTALRSHDDGRH